MTRPPRISDEELRDQIEAELEELASWSPVELGPVLDGEVETRLPTVLRFDGEELGLFYAGAVNGIHGDSGIGKSWTVLHAAAEVMADDQAVLLLDYEANVTEAVGRLRSLGVPTLTIRTRLLYVAPSSVANRAAVDSLVALVAERSVGLVVIDSLGEAFGLEAVDENHDAEVGPWLRAVPRRLADAGAAVVLVDHSTKAADNPLHPSGSKRKRAAITGASYYVSTEIPPTRDRRGRLYLACAKDRHGSYRRGSEPVAVLDLQPWPDGTISAHLERPSERERGVDVATDALVRALVRAARDEGGELTTNALVEAARVKARRERVLGAVDLAVSRGYLSAREGPRRSRLVTFAREVESTNGLGDLPQ